VGGTIYRPPEAEVEANARLSCDNDAAADSMLLRRNDEEVLMAEKLDTGALFPSMTLNPVGGESIAVPGDLSARYNIVLFYRGHW
jgi:hypothetical protein